MYNEHFVIDENLEGALQMIEKVVLDYDKELSNKGSFIHDYICQQFEESKEEDNQ
ncbi:hypothetical protein [Virgibacillus sp. Bac330]|uniref:hypothetical protein n=1 Tax=Virgibacillus sp. Bac330 TaxID=2419841 RepID=UPI0013CEBA56|nr:hypothetical protein [Virgibacillus sp. Bac330]